MFWHRLAMLVAEIKSPHIPSGKLAFVVQMLG